MLTETFRVNEIIQAVDPNSGHRWEKAKILSFVNDWCVKIKWIEWNRRFVELTVPEIDRVDQVSTIAIIQKIKFVIKFEI